MLNCERSDNGIFIGNWTPIPKDNFLTSLKPGRYFLQSNKEIQRRLQAKLATFNHDKVGSNGHNLGSSKSELCLEEDDLGKLLVTTVGELAAEINQKIGKLNAVQGGEYDPMLEEMYKGLDSLLAMAYDQYIQVQNEYWRISNRQHLLIEIASAPILDCRDTKIKSVSVMLVEDPSQLYTVIAAFPETLEKQGDEYYQVASKKHITFIPYQMTNLHVNLCRLEEHTPKTVMDALWKRYYMEGKLVENVQKIDENQSRSTNYKKSNDFDDIPLMKRLKGVSKKLHFN